MRILTRDFTTKEKILIGFLIVVLLAFAYYQFVDKPVREGLEHAEAQKANLESELAAVQERVATLRRMKAEIDQIKTDGTFKEMPSYNNSKAVTELLNNLLGDLGYRISFANVAQTGDLVRRNITLEFSAPDYDTVERVLSGLAGSDFRCLIGNLTVSRSSRTVEGVVQSVLNVSAGVTFYETTVDGQADQGIHSGK